MRIVAATNRDLGAAVRERALREDLFYRLKVVELALPPLRDRLEDVETLATHFSQTYTRANGRQPLELSADLLACLHAYDWPGNVRELENAIERAVVLADPEARELDRSLLPEAIRDSCPPASRPCDAAEGTREEGLGKTRTGADEWDRTRALHEMSESERVHILRDMLTRTGGNAAAVARRLGVSPRSIRYYADKYDLLRRSNRPKGG